MALNCLMQRMFSSVEVFATAHPHERTRYQGPTSTPSQTNLVYRSSMRARKLRHSNQNIFPSGYRVNEKYDSVGDFRQASAYTLSNMPPRYRANLPIL